MRIDYDNLKSGVRKRLSDIENTKHAISAEKAMNEEKRANYVTSFEYFDDDKDGRLDYDQFDSCMISLGVNVGVGVVISEYESICQSSGQAIQVGSGFSFATKECYLTNEYQIGQLDTIVPFPATSEFLRKLGWKGQEQFLEAPQEIWYSKSSPRRVNGYVKQANNVLQVLVRNAGHMVPMDQPKASLEMIRNFIYDLPF
ncbi:alpha-actinin-2-like [Octopus sinensis]|uniref:Alpha-actinin-2-like n=1 Tax=Octopus sinensis TaxID=2607531 RepID=A0A6P7U152_9MOLL|nr:alpha-actinin-2-like [Octopus sinensis]